MRSREISLRAFSAQRFQHFVPGALPQAVTFRAFGALKTIVSGMLSQVFKCPKLKTRRSNLELELMLDFKLET
jgi:hypothetical protein